MKNIKFIIGFSIFGFLISFVSGFASNSTFLKMLLNAFIFLFVFAFLGAAIVFLWDKFLSTEFQNAEYVASKNANSPKTSGQTVDITIQDEALQNDDNASQFYVGSNHQMLTKDDISEKTKNNNESDEKSEQVDSWGSDIKTVSVNSKKQDVSDVNNSGFVPVALAENPANISSSEAKSGLEYQNIDNSSMNNESSGSVELDVLPDLQELQNIQEMTSSKDVQEAPSVESTGFVVEDAKKAVSEANADSKDAALMAKAISTLLSKE